MATKRPADLIAKVLGDRRLEPGFRRGAALRLWPEVAGEALAALTEAERLEDGVLFVRVPDAVVGHQLTYLREDFVQRYAARLPGLVREMRFQVGAQGKKPRAKEKPAPPPALSGDEERRIRHLAEAAPDELKGVILRAGRAVSQKRKADPNPPCLICAAPSKASPCEGCQKLLSQQVVVREAARLSRLPLKPKLEGDYLSAARYLAQTRLEAQMRELLPEVVKQPELIPILQDTARRYLQLRTGEKAVSTYRNLLPESLQSLLREI